MKLKLAALGLLIAGAVAFPVLAQGVHHDQGVGHGVTPVTGPLGTGWFCDDDGDDDFFEDGGFTQWVSTGHGTFEFQMGDTVEDTDDVIGLRIATSARAKSLSVDWNLGNSDDPELLVLLNDGVRQRSSLFDLSVDNSPAVTQTNVGGGFTRIKYNAAADGRSGDRFAGVYWFDNDDEGFSLGTQRLRNILVNGVPVIPNTVLTQVDCTVEYFQFEP